MKTLKNAFGYTVKAPAHVIREIRRRMGKENYLPISWETFAPGDEFYDNDWNAIGRIAYVSEYAKFVMFCA